VNHATGWFADTFVTESVTPARIMRGRLTNSSQ
jgi:hypothetical protein